MLRNTTLDSKHEPFSILESLKARQAREVKALEGKQALLQEKQANQLKEQAKELENKQKKYDLYNELLENLQFQEQYSLEESSNLLNTFCEQSFSELAYKTDEFLHLMGCLVELKRFMPNIIDSPLYSPSREILIKGIQLAPLALQSEDYFYRKEKISALSKAIEAATKVIKHPGDQTQCDLLTISIETMRSSIEGSPILREENRLLYGLMGASLILLGAALLTGGFSLIGVFAAAPSISLGVFLACEFLMLGGTFSALLGVTALLDNIFNALLPDMRKNELQLSREIACSLQNVTASNPSTFFSKRDANTLELQPLNRQARTLKAT